MTEYTKEKWKKWLRAACMAMFGAWAVSGVLSMSDRYEVAKMTKKMKTHCVGRFLIDLPENAKVVQRGAFIDGLDISIYTNETEQEFTTRVAEKEAEINATLNNVGTKNMESDRELKRNGFVGKIFVFGRNSTYVFHDSEKITSTNVALAGYVRANGVSFNFTAKYYDPHKVAYLERLIDQLRPLAENEIPTEPGFCIQRGIIQDPLTADQGERMTLFASLPGHPDMGILFDTLAGTNPGPDLLVRNAKVAAEESPYVRAHFTTLREGKRTINGIPGVELVQRVREENFATVFGFQWESLDKKDDVFLPFLMLELDSGRSRRQGGKPVQSSLSEAAMVDLWDAISSSLRLRPTSSPKVSEVAPPTIPPLGTYASAGTACPQSGWWRCSDGGPGMEISGGRSHYLRKGERVPQARLEPPGIWQRIWREESREQSGTPSSWTLIDYRRRPRTPSPFPLADATVAGDGTSARAGQFAGEAMQSRTPVGQSIETGMSCPDSGWWHCPESEAVDGTRWFAQGRVLPPATFHASLSWFDKITGAHGLVRRRSVWQFLRPDAGPAIAPSAAVERVDPAG